MTKYVPVLLGFNLINETFNEVKIPDGLIEEFFKNGVPKQAYMMEVTELMGCLSLILIDGINTDTWLIGSCMGLACLLNGEDIVFINIITRRHVIVTFPDLDACPNITLISLHGFGMIDDQTKIRNRNHDKKIGIKDSTPFVFFLKWSF
jgi:hypothetical protein